MKRYCLALDLKDDPALIAQYEEHHRKVWPEIISSIKDSGIVAMEIYRYRDRLFMIMEVNDDFSFERKLTSDTANSKVHEWEELMMKYQQPFAGSAPGEKWMLMDKIFDLTLFENEN
jgi:L-rhamnose mutarotase